MGSRIINTMVRGLPEKDQSGYGFQHFAGIYKNGKLMFRGCNHLRNSYNGECICFSTHAEMDVLSKVIKQHTLRPFKDMIDLSDHVIIVVRLGRDGLLKNSRPCNQCLETMTKYRIKKIMYSTDSGTFYSEKPCAMEHLHESSGWLAFKTPGRLK